MNEREYRWELTSQGRAVGGGRLLEGERVVLGPTGVRKDNGFATVPWHVRLTVASGRLLVASVDANAPAFVGGSKVPSAFVELATPSAVVAGNVEVRLVAVRASASVVTSAKRQEDDTIAARASEPSLTMLAGSGEHQVPASRTSISPVRAPSRPAPVLPRHDADASMMTRNAPLPAPNARARQEDLRETRTLAPVAPVAPPPPSPWPPMPMTFARPAPALVEIAPSGPATERTAPPAAAPYAHPSAAYAPVAPPAHAHTPLETPAAWAPTAAGGSAAVPTTRTTSATSERPTPPTASRRPRAAVLALGAAGLFAALALVFAAHRSHASPRASAPRPTATAPAGLAATAAATPSAATAPSATTAAGTRDPKEAPRADTKETKPTVAASAARSPGRDPLAERRIAKALLAGDTAAATTETDALLAVHPEIVEYRTMRRALRRMAPPSAAE